MIEPEEVYVKLAKKHKLSISELKLIWECKFRKIVSDMSKFSESDPSTHNNYFINEFGKFVLNKPKVEKIKKLKNGTP